MVQLLEGGAYLLNGTEIVPDTRDAASVLESQLAAPRPRKTRKSRRLPMESWRRTIPPETWRSFRLNSTS